MISSTSLRRMFAMIDPLCAVAGMSPRECIPDVDQGASVTDYQRKQFQGQCRRCSGFRCLARSGGWQFWAGAWTSRNKPRSLAQTNESACDCRNQSSSAWKIAVRRNYLDLAPAERSSCYAELQFLNGCAAQSHSTFYYLPHCVLPCMALG